MPGSYQVTPAILGGDGRHGKSRSDPHQVDRRIESQPAAVREPNRRAGRHRSPRHQVLTEPQARLLAWTRSRPVIGVFAGTGPCDCGGRLCPEEARRQNGEAYRGGVSDFFERPPLDPEPRAQRPESPPWTGPPEGVLPGVVGVEMVLARNARAAVFVGGLVAYPTGLEFEVRVLTAGEEWLDPSLNGVYLRPGGPREGNYEQMLRFGVEFSDGRKVTNVGGHAPREGEPESAVLWGRGGGGGGSQWQQGFWLWPLPPPGPLSFVCEWPAAGLSLSRADIDAQVVIDAASRAQAVFPGQPSDGPAFSWSTGQVIISSQSADQPPSPSS
jgi:hypothetical protein